MGLEKADEMAFSIDKAHILKSLEQTEEFISLLQTGVPFPVRDFHDLREAFHRIQIDGTCLSVEDLFALKPSLNVLEAILRYGHSESADNTPRLKSLIENVFIERSIFTEANRLVDDKAKSPITLPLNCLKSAKASAENKVELRNASGKSWAMPRLRVGWTKKRNSRFATVVWSFL